MTLGDGGAVTMSKKVHYRPPIDMDMLELTLIDGLEARGITPFEIEVSGVRVVRNNRDSYELEVKFNAEVDSGAGRLEGSAFLIYKEEEASFEELRFSYSS